MTGISVCNEGSLDEVVVKRARQPTFIAVGRKTEESIGEVGGNLGVTVRGKECQKSISSGFSRVVSDAGFESDRDDSVRYGVKHIGREKDGVGCALFDDGVGKEIVHALGDGFVRCFAVYEVAANRPYLSHINAVVGLQLTTNDVATNVAHSFPLTRGDFHTCNWHVVHRARWAKRGCSMRSL